MKQAFTLIEMAIVLVIIGLFLTGGISIFAFTIKGMKARQQNEESMKMVNVINKFVIDKGVLPLVTDLPNLETLKTDIFNKTYRYYIPQNLHNKKICEYTANTVFQVFICKDVKCEDNITINDVAYVFASDSLNLKQDNIVDHDTLPSKYQLFNNLDGRDDIVKYYTLKELKAVIGCGKDDNSTLRFMSTDLPAVNIKNANTNDLRIYVRGGDPKGGTPKYKWCIDEFSSLSANEYAHDSLKIKLNGAKVNVSTGTKCLKNYNFDIEGSDNITVSFSGSLLNKKSASAIFTVHVQDANRTGTVIKNTFMHQIFE